ncbi:ABC transporter permease [Paenibacillus puerhi]|uniref:ABC transporter permease n=1 Tax=Paenibacillus puerhi TaxID=2692622 RepID=UPI00135A3B6C|nr:ABC transporter permease subunit [Paenibacillus puerhi]
MNRNAEATRTNKLITGFKRYWLIYLMMLPGFLYLIIFQYIPMYGIIIAFQDFKPFGGIESIIFNPDWVGLKHFRDFFSSYYFTRLLTNTLLISVYKLVLSFASAILLALLINEVRNKRFKKIAQSISYLPHFLSAVIIAGLVSFILSPSGGPINGIMQALGSQPIDFLGNENYFRSILVVTHVWASVGWGSIVYLAALAGTPVELYESADLDGASRFQKMWYISIPSISHIIIILLILDLGNILDAGFEQVLLLYSPGVYSVGDIIDTYVYREGLLNANYSYASAIGLFKNVVALVLILLANKGAKMFGDKGVW